jgi:23S rRNA (cytosine1962-C5)-methyltransferase
LDQFLAANVHGLSRKQVKQLINADQVRVNGRRERKAARVLTPGQTVQVDYRPSLVPPATMEVERVLRDEGGWIAVDKPPGLSTHRSSEDGLGVPERLAEVLGEVALKPIHRLDRETSGVLLLARDADVAAALSALFATRAVQKTYRAVVRPAPREDSGTETEPDGTELSWAVLGRSSDGSRAELAVSPKQGRTHQIRIQLAAAGTPIVGDLEHGRPVPGGAPRMALHAERLSWAGFTIHAPVPVGWRDLLEPPRQTASPSPRQRRGPPPGSERRTLTVSAATARILRAGHPWVIRDADTGDLGPFQMGALADLVDPRGDFVACAIVDPGSSICARVIDSRPGRPPRWGGRARGALEFRQALLADPQTTAVRLVHGEADGLPGLSVDLWGDVVVATRSTAAAAVFTAEVYNTITDVLGNVAIYERDHFKDLRRGAAAPRDATLPGRMIQGTAPRGPWTVLERGLRFEVDPLPGLSSGLYPDQRTNRTRLAHLLSGTAAQAAPGRSLRVANLFGHTGAFSVAAAAAGATEAVTVDLSPAYCDWTRRNLELNGFDPQQHVVAAADSISWLRDTSAPLDGVILDPPAFARGRVRAVDWSARRDYGALVEAACRRLVPGGWMLCCVHVGGLPKGWLRRQIDAGFRKAGRRLERTEAARPAADFPRRRGFPEGVSFDGLIAWMDR